MYQGNFNISYSNKALKNLIILQMNVTNFFRKNEFIYAVY